MDHIALYAPFAKKDEAKRMVYGYISTETLDSQGEIVKQDALKAAMPEYMKFGNVREMHQPSAVGKTQQANFDENGTYVAVKVVDDNAWKKVQEGVYNGFSIGGKVLTKEEDAITALKLSEISLVDRPANPDAVFDVIKMHDKMANDPIYDGNGNIEPQIIERPTPPPAQLTKENDVEDVTKDAGDATTLASMIESLQWMRAREGREGDNDTTSALDKAIAALKPAVVSEINEDDCDSDGMMMSEKTDDLAKDAMSTDQRNALNDSDFAYIDSKGGRHLPINDAAHVRNALARFNQTQFENDTAKSKAKAKIMAAAKKFGIEVSDDKKAEAIDDVTKVENTAKSDETPKERDDLKMPTDDQIVAELEKQGVPVNEQSIAMVKSAEADRILAIIKQEQEAGVEHDKHMSEVANHLNTIADTLSKTVTATTPQPFTYVKIEPKTDAAIAKSETPAEEKNTPEALNKTETTAPSSDALAKLETLEKAYNDLAAKEATQAKELASLKEQLAKFATSPAEVPVKTSYAVVERFDDGINKKDQLKKDMDEMAELLNADPHNPTLRAKAQDLQKAWMSLSHA